MMRRDRDFATPETLARRTVKPLWLGVTIIGILDAHVGVFLSFSRHILETEIIVTSGPDLAGGRPGAQPNYGSISVTGASLGAHETRGSRPGGRGRAP